MDEWAMREQMPGSVLAESVMEEWGDGMKVFFTPPEADVARPRYELWCGTTVWQRWDI